MSRKKLISVVILATVLSIGIGYLLVSQSDDESDDPSSGSGGLEAAVAGIAGRITQVEYSSTSTLIHLEFEHPTLDESRLGNLFFFTPDDMTLEGFNPAFPMVHTIRRGVSGIDRRELRVGAVEDPLQAVTLSIARLCVLRSADTPACDYRDGPWTFRWTPGLDAVDPIARRSRIDQMQEIDGVVVSLLEVQISSNEMLVTATFEGESLVTGQRVVTGDMRMTTTSGKDVHAEGGGGSSDEPSGIVKFFRFPAPDPGLTEVRITAEIEPGPGAGSRELNFTVSLP